MGLPSVLDPNMLLSQTFFLKCRPHLHNTICHQLCTKDLPMPLLGLWDLQISKDRLQTGNNYTSSELYCGNN